MNDLALELRGVKAGYGPITVLRGVDLAVPYGSLVALLGPNGGGKSTTLRVIAGQLPVTGGEVIVAGRKVNGSAPDELARRGVCLIPEGRGIFPNLSVRENLSMATHTGTSLQAIEEIAYARFTHLGPRRRQLAGTLSGGEQQMLAMARALATNPALLLLDELSMGLAPIVVEQLYEIVAQVAKEGVSIVVVEQFARAILGIADWVGIMLRGRISTFGTPATVEAELSTAYLGD
ncbi:MAG: branched-chain amino acid transport system ATP-binding protein [Actinomycetota bacterium]|jgi:branched-chain amino acid transport system ATP-binding protein|nr:branched-chain amino acid transport system ATP-binding protein [Actinomycetota bacterium]